MKILSCGAGMQSTALALMSCEKKMLMAKMSRRNVQGQLSLFSDEPYPEVPIYDCIIFCNLGYEAPWVYRQVDFIRRACARAEIPFVVLDTHLYDDYISNFGKSRVVSVPFWTIGEDGRKAKLRRNCTIDKKILAIQKYVRWELLGYAKGQHLKAEDIQGHEMHIGFSWEERRRMFDSYNPMFVNRFPLVDMGAERPDNYKYILEKWGLETRASACCICPFHQNYFFKFLKENHEEEYNAVVRLDALLEEKQPLTPIRSEMFISRSRKRIIELTDEECDDAQYFLYNGKRVWNGF